MATPQQEQAQQVLYRYQADQARITSNTALTKDAKRIALAQLWVTATDELETLRQQQDGNATARKQDLQREVYGLPTGAPTNDVTSYRDALDRTNALPLDASGDREAARLYDIAVLSSDRILAKALVARAFSLQDGDTLDRYITDFPDTAKAVTELWSLQNSKDDFIGNLVFVAPKPNELGDLNNDFAIRALAQQPAPTI